MKNVHGVGRAIIQIRATAGYGRRFVLRDHLGSTSTIVNGSGTTIAKDLYLPYGDVRYQWRSGAPPIATQTQYRYTGQRLETGIAAPSPATWNGAAVDRGLYFYNARWYDASLARFIQPDTIVPEPGNPQALNRFAYAANNPLRYVDPSGHCEFDAQDNITRFDCSAAEFEGLSAKDRIRWMQAFQRMFGYGGWFNNIIDIITFFDESATLQNMEPGSWASWADAGVLEAIQNGRVLYDEGVPISSSGGAAALWQQFFYTVFQEGTEKVGVLKPLWAKAEQAGVEWGTVVADAQVGRPGGLEGQLIDNFVLAGDTYRYIASVPNGGETVGTLAGSAICGSVCGWVGAKLGDWFTTPSSQLPTGRGPTYYSAKAVEALTVTISR